MSTFFAYVIHSTVDGRLYNGHTQNIDQRLKEHNAGIAKSKKAYRPWKLVYSERFQSREEAVKRERFLKSGAGREFLEQYLAP